ncbi:hypothetical protein HPB49_008929 [Dermacentor silvarum]|uniref:Uncharacterized protein n=1 Tax=Dermacentor silvarum TaxID=543639 RepID=A0ACB8DYW7_DERSI|nr:hypothetical protein HPB49_008929 [Dermacentor silvarum]
MARAPGRAVFLLLGAAALLFSTPKTAAAQNTTAEEALTTLAGAIDMATTTQAPQLRMVDRMRQAIRERLDASYDTMAEQFLNAKMSRQCAFKLLKFVHSLRNFEPWTLRMIDASGKYPTGLFQGSLSDLGAYDQCIETVIRDEYGGEKVRAQYCNMYIKLGKDMSFLEHVDDALRLSHRRTPTFSRFQNDDIVHGVKIGLCIVHECKPEDIEAIAGVLITGDTKVTVTDCATNIPPEISTTQAAIIAVLGVIAFLMAASTAIDIYLNNTRGDEPRGTALTALSSFSVVANSKMLVRVTDDKQSDAYKLRFLHGMRFFSIGWVVLGHSYSTFNFTNMVMTGTLNKFYTHPSYHGVAFFFGAMTQLFLYRYPSVKISKMLQAGMWLMSAACGLTSILIMYDWNRGEHPPEWAKLSFAFSERLLWSVWLSWLTFACSTGRGGFIAKWLSWSAFVPFSRLSFGVYLLHVPYYYIRLNVTRERIFFSHYSMVTQYFGALVASYLLSYILFIACEAPTGRIEKLLLMPKRRPQLHDTKSTVPYVEDKSDKLSPQMLYKPKAETGSNGTVVPPGQSSYL